MENLAWYGFILWFQCIFQFIPPSYSHLQASIYKENVGGFFFQWVQSAITQYQ